MRHAADHWDPNERTAEMICKRLAVLSFAAIQSSTIAITHPIFDLAALPRLSATLDILGNEVKTELAAESGMWSKKAVARMFGVDSALRESMRLRGFISRGVIKKVVAVDGVVLPNGIRIPRGTNVGVAQYSVHLDEDIYAYPEVYDPFRFSGTTYGKKEMRLAMVSPSPDFMAFSYGPHAW
jgi:hypothetical protein